MKIALITGSAGLIGGEAVSFFSDKFDLIIGIDNDMRHILFGKEASTDWNKERLTSKYANYKHYETDIRNVSLIDEIFRHYNSDIKLIIHAAAQPSHDWAAKDPLADFSINANGTMNLLEATRKNCPDAVFCYMSSNKVYGDMPNKIVPLIEKETRFEVQFWCQQYEKGITESMNIDNSTHSLFGVSKLSADLMTQEYGKYFGMNTGIFRGGCLTGTTHSGTKLHGFLSYLVKCAKSGEPYTIFGYKGKQVRDNIHSYDLVNMLYHFYQNPRNGEVYNVGGGTHSNCSILEAISMIEDVGGNKINYTIHPETRIGYHKWYISCIDKFRSHYPEWEYKYDLQDIIKEMINSEK